MYCSEQCAQNIWHAVEFNVVFRQSSSFVLRSVLIGINSFTTIEDMMAFVNFCQSTDPEEISESFATPESKYR